MASKTPDIEYEPLPSEVYSAEPVTFHLREGSDLIQTLRVAARYQRRIAFAREQINTVIAHQRTTGVLPPRVDTIERRVNRVRLAIDLALAPEGDRGCPAFMQQVVSAARVDELDLARLYTQLVGLCDTSVKIGWRLDAMARTAAGIPIDVPEWSAVSTYGVLGWRLISVAEDEDQGRTIEFDYHAHPEA